MEVTPKPKRKSSALLEAIHRNEVTTLLLSRGYNVYFPAIDEGIDFIIHYKTRESKVFDPFREDLPNPCLVQQKSRWTINKKYEGHGIWIGFKSHSNWYLAPHDWMLKQAIGAAGITTTKSWIVGGGYSRANLPKILLGEYAPYQLDGTAKSV